MKNVVEGAPCATERKPGNSVGVTSGGQGKLGYCLGKGCCLSNLTDYLICQTLRGCVSLPGQKNPEWLEDLHDDTSKKRKQRSNTYVQSYVSATRAKFARGKAKRLLLCCEGGQRDAQAAFAQFVLDEYGGLGGATSR